MKLLSQVRIGFPRSGIREIMERSAHRAGAIHLEVGEPNVDTPDYICDGARLAMEQGFTHYTPNAGLLSLRESIVLHLAATYGISADPSQIIVTPGAVTAITISLLALVDAGEEVLLPDPGWPNYTQMLLNQEAVPVYYPLLADNGFVPDINYLESVVTEKTKAIIINTPANPTGATFGEDVIRSLLRFASKHDLYVISDEVYDGIVFDGRHRSPKQYDTDDRVISVFGFSKNYAMTGWRVGYAVAPAPIAPLLVKLMEPVVSCASSVSQKAAETAINGPKDFIEHMVQVYRRRRDLTYEKLTTGGLKAYLPQGAFYMLIDIEPTGLSSKQFALDLLEEEAVAVAPGSAFGTAGDNLIRISLATEESELLEAAERIVRFCRRRSQREEAGSGT